MMSDREIFFIIGVTVGAAGMFCLVSTAKADCLQWGVDQRGTQVCMADDAVNRNPITPNISGRPGTSVTPTAPKCDDGWTLVADSAMRPMCARELRKPQ